MSYNPKIHRLGNDNPVRKRRQPLPNTGLKHSDIARKLGPQMVTLDDMGKRVPTDLGWRVPYFSNDAFEMFYEYMCGNSGTGKILSETGDRCVRILRGQLFVYISGSVFPINQGNVISFYKGQEYELSTAADIELLVSQSAGYDDSITRKTESVKDLTRVLESQQEIPQERYQETLAAPRRGHKNRTREAAEKMEQQKQARRKALENGNYEFTGGTAAAADPSAPPPDPGPRLPLAGQQIIGVNPRPIGSGNAGY